MVTPKKLLEETEQRYAERREIREDTKRKLASGTPLQADEPQRVQKRLGRLAKNIVTMEVPSTEGVTTMVGTVLKDYLISAECYGNVRFLTG